MARKKHVYASIQKVEKQEDGTLKVYGYASSGAKDSDGETVTPEAMKAAIPDYMKFGAVREMHQASAAGTAISANVDDTGKTEFAAHVVDPVAVLKVETGVYKGFSIGGKVTERDKLDKSIIKGLNLVEVSLVDRPANPEAIMTMFKAEKTPEDDVEELAELLDSGTVTPAQLLALAKGAKLGEASADGAAPSAVATKPAASEPSTTPAVQSVDTSAKSAASDDLKKGMYGVSEFACALQNISWMVTDAAWESEYEGDNSPIPAKMLEWLKAGVAIFKEMAEEEVNEMIAGLRVATGTPELIAMAQKAGLVVGPDAITKAGAKFSKATKEALGALHDTVKVANDHLDKLGYKEADDDVEAAAKAAKAKTPADDTIGITEDEPLQKAVTAAVAKAIAPLNDALEKARKESSDLRQQVEEMGKRAAPGKALLKAITLNKSQDVSTADTPLADDKLAAEGTEERAHQEMRKIFAGRGIALNNAGIA